MSPSFEEVFSNLVARIRASRVEIILVSMDIETPGKFDGRSITINSAHEAEARCYYLAHSFGSIVQWSLNFEEVKQLFRELRAVKPTRDRHPQEFEQALERFCAFEEAASEYAVWLLVDLGHGHVVDRYTEFFRADLDAMQIYHREGLTPPWPEFFADWKAKVVQGEKSVARYTPRAVPAFKPVLIPQEQEVIQERDGQS